MLRSARNYLTDEESYKSGLECLDGSKAVQAAKDECDINVIVRRFGIGRNLPVGVRMPSYGDFSSSMDYHSSMNAIISAKESFMAMPSDVRARFHNDPGEFVAFCSDSRNQAEAVKLGLAVPGVQDLVRNPTDGELSPAGATAGSPAGGAPAGGNS